MPSFRTHPFSTPIGRNVFLRSTRAVKTESGTCSHETVPGIDIDGHPGQKILQPGVVMARITSGPDIGKIGPFQDVGSAANEVQTLTESGTISGGTFDLTVLGVDFTDIAYNVTDAQLQVIIREGLAESDDADVREYADSLTITGGPIGTTPFTFTFVGPEGGNVDTITADATGLTGSTPGITVATPTPGVAGATDGRGDTANIVGLNNTFLPWQLIEGDREVAFIYDAAVIQNKCLKLNANGVFVSLDNTTAAAMVAKKSLNITFHAASTENGDN